MKELSLHLLDIAQNSITAGATRLDMALEESADGVLRLTIADNGRGMSPALLSQVTDPFTTTRTTRKMGLGIPLLRLSAEQTGGGVTIESTEGIGTTVTATFQSGHIDCQPLGDMAGTLALIVQGAPLLELRFSHVTPSASYLFDTREVRAQLGTELSLAEPEIVLWLRDYLTEQEELLHQGNTK